MRVGRDIAYTDSAGHFQPRCSKHGPFALSVAPEEFLGNTIYEVVSAPVQARAEADELATEIQIVVRRRMAVK